jgi:hypothetical protein
MISGESYGKRPTPRVREDGGSERTVGSIRAHSIRHRKPCGVKHRREGTQDRAPGCRPFPDVVEEGRFDRLVIVSEHLLNAASHVDGVTLIGRTLRPEHVRTRFAEPVVNELLVLRPGRLRSEVAEEPLDQVGCLFEVSSHDEDLHLMHNRDVGR